MAARNGYITDRQLELLAHVASGMTINEAAATCHLATQSAYNTLGAARHKNGAASITHLAMMALERGWLEKVGGRYVPADSLQSV